MATFYRHHDEQTMNNGRALDLSGRDTVVSQR